MLMGDWKKMGQRSTEKRDRSRRTLSKFLDPLHHNNRLRQAQGVWRTLDSDVAFLLGLGREADNDKNLGSSGSQCVPTVYAISTHSHSLYALRAISESSCRPLVLRPEDELMDRDVDRRPNSQNLGTRGSPGTGHAGLQLARAVADTVSFNPKTGRVLSYLHFFSEAGYTKLSSAAN